MTLSKSWSTAFIIIGFIFLALAVYQYIENRKSSAALLVVIGLSLFISGIVEMKKAGYKDLKERYNPLQDKDAELAKLAFAGDYADYSVQRPTFKAKLAPRFDPYRQGGGYIRGSFPTTYDVLSVGSTPVTQEEMGAAAALDYSTLGGEDKLTAKAQSACGAAKASQYNLAKEVAFAGTDYVQPQDLLPSPDLRSCFKDPTDPGNYMYDRTLFSPLKQRSRNFPDRIRGDLYISPNRFGWFDAPAIPSVDLAKGAVNGIIADISSQTDLSDTLYNRENPMMTVKEQQDAADLPWGPAAMHFL